MPLKEASDDEAEYVLGRLMDPGTELDEEDEGDRGAGAGPS